MASISFAPSASATRRPMPTFKFKHEQSDMQMGFYRTIYEGEGNVILKALAGSGKSTSIINSVLYAPPRSYVTVLAFNAPVAKEMREKIEETAKEHGADFYRVQAKTFHSLGYGAVLKHLGKKHDQVEPSDKKCRRILKAKLERDEYRTYGSFCERLVGFAKGEGVGTSLKADEPAAWHNIIAHHDLFLEDEGADVNRAVDIARKLLEYSSKVALRDASLDYDDMIYLPILWNLRLWQNDFLYIDEAQDTNPCRRALARKALRPGGRLIAVGDPNQGIFGFTGATSDAMDLIKKDFSCVELPLTVSYRCPQAAEALVRDLVPEFSVHPDAPQGAVLHLSVKKGLERLGPKDAVLCRNTAPLVELAFSLLAEGRGCVILGKDIGAQLITLIESMGAGDVEGLEEKLRSYADREVAKFLKRDEEEKAEALADRVGSLIRVMEGLKEGERTVDGLIAKIEGMFRDDGRGVLTLCTGHKSKGLEWPRVALLEPGLMPSKWARQVHQYKQEKNLMYVVRTRFKDEFIFLDGHDGPEERPAALAASEAAGDDLRIPAFLKRNAG